MLQGASRRDNCPQLRLAGVFHGKDGIRREKSPDTNHTLVAIAVAVFLALPLCHTNGPRQLVIRLVAVFTVLLVYAILALETLLNGYRAAGLTGLVASAIFPLEVRRDRHTRRRTIM